MTENKFSFFQFTNFVAEYRVSTGGTITVLPHGAVRRRVMSEYEVRKLSKIDPYINSDFKEGQSDISDVNHILSLTTEEIFTSEKRFGGGKEHHVIPRIILLARERLAGL